MKGKNMVTYENKVLEAKLTGLVNESISLRSLMTVDTSLAGEAGLTKTVNKYSYNGKVETLSDGSANSVCGTVTLTPTDYKVKRYQQTFRYNDMDIMRDPDILDAALKSAAELMSEQIKEEYLTEAEKISNVRTLTGNVTYDDIVDALASIGRDAEEGLFIIMGTDSRAAIRKDEDFISSRGGEMLYSGQFGTLCGLPVICSSAVPPTWVIITEKSAVKFFVKKDAAVEQDRNIETKDNTVVCERHGFMALVDDSRSVIMGKTPKPLTLEEKDKIITVTAGGDDSLISVSRANVEALPDFGEDISSWSALPPVPGAYTSGAKVCVAQRSGEGKCIAAAFITVA
jgi:hypothetical protein